MRRLRFLQPGQQVINWRSGLPTLLTLAAMLAGFLSILVVIQGIGVSETDPAHAGKLYRWSLDDPNSAQALLGSMLVAVTVGSMCTG